MALLMGSGRVVPITITSITSNQSKSGITPSTASQIIRPDSGYTGLSAVTVNAIPASYIIPSGTYTVTNSGTYNISTYASVSTPAMANPTWTAATLNSSQAKVIYSITLNSGFKSNNQTFSSSYILPSIAGITITPGDISQTAVAAYKWTLGSVIVASVPSTMTIYQKIYDKNMTNAEANWWIAQSSTIKSYTFYYCSTITSVGGSVSYIESYAFAYCSNLVSISFPNVTSIYGSAFTNCSNLTSVYLPNVSSLQSNAFYYCSNLISINLPNVTRFNGEYNFQGCSKLVNISLPELTYIYGSDFQGCSSLETISFPKLSIVSAYSSCFYNCVKLKSIYLMSTSMVYFYKYPSQNWKIFDSSPVTHSSYLGGSYASIYVPTSLLATYKADSGWASISDRFVGI